MAHRFLSKFYINNGLFTLIIERIFKNEQDCLFLTF